MRFYEFVLTRMNTSPGSFGPPNGCGVVERVPYSPAATFAKDKSILDVDWVD